MIALSWTLFAVYLVGTFYLAYLGHKKTSSFDDFAVGGRDMGAGMAGLTLGACLASTATFVINPGFVYAYGLPALIALTIPLFLGVFAGLAVMGPGFREHGKTATTLPIWLGERFGSPGLRGWFAFLCLLHVFYIVMIVVGAAFVMSATMGVSYPLAVAIVVLVVFSYVFLGGTYAHAYTNTAQGLVMLVVACLIFGFAAKEMGSPAAILASLKAQDPRLVGLTFPGSPFYRHWVEVLVCPFFVGFALVAQPHLLVKTLYLKRTRDMVKFGAVGLGCFIVFSLVLSAGLAARVGMGAGLNQDVVTSQWLATAFPPVLGAVVSVAILAAAMSTLDGLLVALSCIVGSDLVGHPAFTKGLTKEQVGRRKLFAGRVTVIVLGGVAWIVALSPPELVAIFATVGTYGLLVAALPAVLYGVLCERPPSGRSVVAASVVGLAIHMGLYYGGVTINTGLTATIALLVSLPIPLIFPRAPEVEASVEQAAPDAELVGAN